MKRYFAKIYLDEERWKFRVKLKETGDVPIIECIGISKCSFPPMAGPIQVIEKAEVLKKRFKPGRRKIAVNIGLAIG
ncbi:MAG: hypothetical protein L6420_09595 [Elusimicrobia bacterium]|nr:hypothetical protein [Elusimicrobiota bacterium]